MKPRITFSTTRDGHLEIWVNETGRDLLVRELQSLSERWDHVHFGPEYLQSEMPVRSRPYQEGDTVIEFGKILYRTDIWDQQHFPHVLTD